MFVAYQLFMFGATRVAFAFNGVCGRIVGGRAASSTAGGSTRSTLNAGPVHCNVLLCGGECEAHYAASSNLIIFCATPFAEAGFWPVTSRPSAMLKSCQGPVL